MAILISILKSVGLWILKAVLGSFADGLLRADQEAAVREKDALKTQLESQESGKNLEVEIIEAQREIDKRVEESKDPFGVEEYNR